MKAVLSQKEPGEWRGHWRCSSCTWVSGWWRHTMFSNSWSLNDSAIDHIWTVFLVWTRSPNFSSGSVSQTCPVIRVTSGPKKLLICPTCKVFELLRLQSGLDLRILKALQENLIWSKCWESLFASVYPASYMEQEPEQEQDCQLPPRWVLHCTGLLEKKRLLLQTLSLGHRDSELFWNGSICCLGLASQFKNPSSQEGSIMGLKVLLQHPPQVGPRAETWGK